MADQRILYTENMVGANHPSLTDTLNRLALVQHNTDGTHKTITGATINLTSNTLTGTLAQFNTALSDGDFASLAGTEALTNKTINLTSNTLTGTHAQFNTALSDGQFAVTDADNAFSAGQTFAAYEREKAVALSGTTINLEYGNAFYKTISGDTTFTVSNPPAADTIQVFVLELTNGGAHVITWFAGLTFPGGVAPVLTASGRDVLIFYTLDGGTTWNGFTAGRNLA